MQTKASWVPADKIIAESNIYKMMRQNNFTDYHTFWKWSVEKKEAFWSQTIDNLGIPFYHKCHNILNTNAGIENAQWLDGAKFNIVDACFQNSDDATAVVIQQPYKPIEKITQKQLELLVNQIANGLRDLALHEGDYIAIDMPMTLEAVAIYLAGIKAGNPVVTIADSFTPNEISVRLNITKPKIIFTQDVIVRGDKTLDLYSKIKQANAPKAIVVKTENFQVTLREGDIYFDEFLSAKQNFNTVIQQPDDMITILFSSGTTGEPKAIPWTHTTPIKSAADGYYHQNIKKNDVVCWPTNLGWMMGPWLVFSSLINKASIALYYDAPMGNSFGKFIENAKVTMLGVVPSIVRNWKNSACMQGLNWDNIKCFSSTGEVSNPDEMKYLMKLANNKPVIEYCGGTEIGGGYVTSTVVQPNIASTFSTQALGGEFLLLDENENLTNIGEVFIVPPIMGLSKALLNKNHHAVYYKGTPKFQNNILRRHGDALERLENGYYKMHGRVDDSMNLGGIKVSSIQIEEIINRLDFVKEAAAIAVSPKGGGPSNLIIYCVENENNILFEEKLKQVKAIIRNQLNPLFKVSDLIKIDILPRTASGKVMRRKLRNLYSGK